MFMYFSLFLSLFWPRSKSNDWISLDHFCWWISRNNFIQFNIDEILCDFLVSNVPNQISFSTGYYIDFYVRKSLFFPAIFFALLFVKLLKMLKWHFAVEPQRQNGYILCCRWVEMEKGTLDRIRKTYTFHIQYYIETYLYMRM